MSMSQPAAGASTAVQSELAIAKPVPEAVIEATFRLAVPLLTSRIRRAG